MSVSTDQLTAIVTLIEDGELDDRMADLQQAIDQRNSRRKDDILKLVKSVWGDAARIVGPAGQTASIAPLAAQVEREGVPYEPDSGPQIPASVSDSASASWPTPIASHGGAGAEAGFSPVSDPMVSGGGGLGGSLGDGDPTFASTGGQIG